MKLAIIWEYGVVVLFGIFEDINNGKNEDKGDNNNGEDNNKNKLWDIDLGYSIHKALLCEAVIETRTLF
jgi:hypothetical protein